MHPGKTGIGVFPRFGGGWMHQFSHVYALQKELLNPAANNWFRALELWHTAREEGVALNSSHYSQMLRQCVQPAAWEAALWILRQMKRENIRPDVVGVSCALATCVEGKRNVEVEKIFSQFSKVMLLDSICFLALIRSRIENGSPAGAIEAGKQQATARLPFSPDTITLLLEACAKAPQQEHLGNFVDELVYYMKAQKFSPSKRCLKALTAIEERYGYKIPFLQLPDPREAL